MSLAAAGFAAPVWANPPAKSLRPVLRPKGLGKVSAPGIDTLVRNAKVSGKLSVAVARVGSGEVLESFGAQSAQPPASVAKALTALYALHYLGGGHRFQTKVVATGPIKNGVVQGDLVLRGGGDPTLDTDGLADLARTLKATGVRGVSGRFLVWGGAMAQVARIDRKQPDHAGYNPAVSGLSLNYNRVHFEWKRSASGYVTTMDARTNKYRPAVSVAKMKVSNRDLPVYTYKAVGKEDHWTVARSALANGGARWLPVRQPELYAGDVFRTMARSHGIQLKAPKITQSAPRGTVMATHQSPDLRTILKGMLKYSTNITAEMVGMAASHARGAQVGSLKASANAMNAWAAETLGMRHAALVDHSGLGEASRMRADELASVLARAGQHEVLKPILKDIALRDGNGRVNKAHPLKVKAKTGTLYFVSALAGYISGPNNTELAFAIFGADVDARARLIGPDRERPKGSRTFNSRSKKLQQKLIERWAAVYRA
ncbi:D-alanyl-D-alanine carboxypeptidase / D-alanyl-D-alanine-endopeptidase (penicillin-binding protein 4) [Shimia haliotis]|uniref:D-alanyl-D-alanine carboxypeptidase / D-alanyl-D-alanine-endopeptidase (Penicillin-binding protein 4) n=1 Tax=Shimia haliotis TaxID=1280847 RepID=A0A1I4CY32_9RHOB|nr:D-alanyl-D-alanine carboxypeptidase / D-alanyl-D-alanine-endopeptidase (penicillin-binding protein 4) [Shimia haliotis]